jgi:hypothetical protein
MSGGGDRVLGLRNALAGTPGAGDSVVQRPQVNLEGPHSPGMPPAHPLRVSVISPSPSSQRLRPPEPRSVRSPGSCGARQRRPAPGSPREMGVRGQGKRRSCFRGPRELLSPAPADGGGAMGGGRTGRRARNALALRTWSEGVRDGRGKLGSPQQTNGLSHGGECGTMSRWPAAMTGLAQL